MILMPHANESPFSAIMQTAQGRRNLSLRRHKVVYTAINLPFGSLAALMTKNQTERGYLNISKMVFAFGGGMVVSATTLPLVNYFGGDSAAWQKTFIIYGVVAIIFFLVVFFTTKEAVTETTENKGTVEKVNIKDALISLVKNKYWVMLLGIFFLNSAF